MLSKNDFSDSDWNLLRETPHLVGVAVMMAGSSGLGTLKESVAAAKSVMEGQSSDVPWIRDLSSNVEMKAAQESLRTALDGIGSNLSVEKIQSLALERASAAITLLSGKATADEVQAFRTWLTTLADNVAKAAKEGGFLGFGGTQVSEGEVAFISKLNAALQPSSAATA